MNPKTLFVILDQLLIEWDQKILLRQIALYRLMCPAGTGQVSPHRLIHSNPISLYLVSTFVFFIIIISQEDEGAPIYWSRAPIYWSPWILFSKFWDGLRRESSDKTRFCVSHDGPTNGLETFCLPCFMFKNKTKNMFVEPKGLQYNGA